MENHIVKKTEQYVRALLKESLTEDHRYHDLPHTLSVRDAALRLGKAYRLPDNELELLEIAALFHDTGFTKQYELHEDYSKEIAEEFLAKNKYPKEKIDKVLQLIDATRVGVVPETLEQKILKDADFNTLEHTYQSKSIALRHEWEVFRGIQMSEDEWLANNIEFWGSHKFYTGEAQALFGEEKRYVLKKFKKQLDSKSKKGGKGKKKSEDDLEFSLNSSKSAQMMFKTTLRNQIDLTNIADNKANIMLTINSAIITVGIPLLFKQIEQTPHLIYSVIALTLTCILSIVFATLATRPAKMGGSTDLNKIEKGNTNLFFFGNFFKMPQQEYRAGLKKVVESDQLLDKTIVNDMYFLGLSLGRKYSRLHTTYSIFMIGMVVTVIVYAISHMIYANH